MPEIEIPNFLGGVRYDVDPTQLADNQFSAMENMDSMGTSPIELGGLQVLGTLKKVGLSCRGSLRKLATANTFDFAVKNALEAYVFDGNALSAVRKNILLWGTTAARNNVLIGAVQDDSNLVNGQGEELLRVFYKESVTNLSSDATKPIWSILAAGSKIIFALHEYKSGVGGSISKAFIMDKDFESAGTVTVTNGSATVTGTGTLFLKLRVGSYVNLDNGVTGGETSTGWYRITGIASDTSMTISPVYSGSTASSRPWRAPIIAVYNPLSITNISALGYFKFRTLVARYDGTEALLYVSEPGDPKTIVSSNVFKIGALGEKILRIVDLGEYALIVKENSLWAFYLDSVDVPSSSVFIVHSYLGGMNNRSTVETPYGLAILTNRDGWYLLHSGGMSPICPQLRTRLKQQFGNVSAIRRAAAAYYDGRLLFALPEFNDTEDQVIFYSYDFGTGVLEQHQVTLSALGMLAGGLVTVLPGIATWQASPKVLAEASDDFVHEVGYFETAGASLVESSVDFSCTSKKFQLGDGKYDGVLRYIILDFNASTSGAAGAITITPTLDRSVKTALVATPTAGGFNRIKIDIGEGDYRGQYLELKFSGTHSLSANEEDATLFQCRVLYDLIPRVA